MDARVEMQTVSPICSWRWEKLGLLKRCFLLLFFLLLIELGQVDAQSNAEKRELGNKLNLSCFISSDPHAANAILMFDFDFNDVNLWKRKDRHTSLPPCSSISSPQDSSCLVCLNHQDHHNQSVYAVCSNLRRGAKVKMEADGEHVEISESKCPKPPSDGQLSAGVIAAIVIMSIIFIIIAGVVGFKYWKQRN